MSRLHLLERAFQLAATGDYFTVTGIAHVLKKEGYSGVEPMFAGAGLRKDLRNAIRAAHAATKAPPASSNASQSTRALGAA